MREIEELLYIITKKKSKNNSFFFMLQSNESPTCFPLENESSIDYYFLIEKNL